MTASVGGVGAGLFSGSGTIAPAYPASIASGDLLILVVGVKPTAFPSTVNVTTPTGWTLLGSATGATGAYSATPAADTGDMQAFAYWKIADGTETGTLTVSMTGNDVEGAQIYRFTKTGTSWVSPVFASANDTTGNSTLTATTAAIACAPDDRLLAVHFNPTDTYTGASAEAFSGTGLTFDTITEQWDARSATDLDMGAIAWTGRVATGTATTAITASATIAGTATNVRGPIMVIRVRDSTAQSILPLGRPSTAAYGEIISGFAKAHQYVANFATDVGPFTGGFGGTRTVTGGQLQHTIPVGFQATDTGAKTIDFTNSYFGAEVVQVPTAEPTMTVELIVESSVGGGGYLMGHAGGTLYIQRRLDGSYFDGTQVTMAYNATAHRWWRIRHDGKKVHFETSPTGVHGSWTIQRTVDPLGWDATAAKLTLASNNNSGTLATGVAIFDNVNLFGSDHTEPTSVGTVNVDELATKGPTKTIGTTISTFGGAQRIDNSVVHASRLDDIGPLRARVPTSWDPTLLRPTGAAGGGARDFDMREMARDMLRAGIEPIFVIGGFDDWGIPTTGDNSDMNFTATDAANIVTSLVAAGFVGARYIVGNEPNNAGNNGSQGNGSWTIAEYCTFFNTVIDAMKAVDSTAKVGGPAWSWDDIGGALTTFIGSCVNRVNGADFVVFHHYGMGTTFLSDADAFLLLPDYEQDAKDLVAAIAASGGTRGASGLVEGLMGEVNWSWRLANGYGGGNDTRFYGTPTNPVMAWMAAVLMRSMRGGISAHQYSDLNNPLGLVIQNGDPNNPNTTTWPDDTVLPSGEGVRVITGGDKHVGYGPYFKRCDCTDPDLDAFATTGHVVIINKTNAAKNGVTYAILNSPSGTVREWVVSGAPATWNFTSRTIGASPLSVDIPAYGVVVLNTGYSAYPVTQNIAVEALGSTAALGSLVVSQSSGAQNITVTSFASSTAFGSLAVTPGAVSVSPSGRASTASYGALTITVGAVSIAPTGRTSTAAYGSLAVSAGPVSVAPTGRASSVALGSLTVTVGAVGVSVSGLTSSSALGSLAVSPGAVTANPSGRASSVAYGSLTVSPGAVAVSPAGLASTVAYGAAQLNHGLAVSGRASTAAYGALAVTTGAVGVTVAGRASTSALGTLSVAPGAVSVASAGQASSVALGSLVVTTGAVSVSPGGTASSNGYGTPTLTTQSYVSVAGRASTASYGTLAVSSGAAAIGVAGLASSVAYGAPTVSSVATINVSGTASGLTLGSLTVTSAAFIAVAGRPSSVTYGATQLNHGLSVSGRPSSVAYGSLSLSVGAVTIQVAGLASTVALGSPVIGSGGANVSVAGRASTAAYGSPAVTVGAVSIAPAGNPSTAAYGSLSLSQTLSVIGRTSSVAYGNLSVTPGAWTVSVAGQPSTASYGSPSVGIGGVAIVVSGRDSTASYGSIGLSTGPVSIAVPGRSSSLALGSLGVSPGAVTVAPAGRSSSVAYGSLSIATGPVSVTVGGLPSGAQTGAIGVAPGALAVTVSGRASTASLGAVGVSVGAPTISPAGLPSGAQYGTPNLSFTIYIPARASTASLGSLAIQPGSVTVSPPGAIPTGSLGNLAVTPGAATVSPTGKSSSSSLGSLSLSTGPVGVTVLGRGSTLQLGIPSLSALYLLSLQGRPSEAVYGTIGLTVGSVEIRPAGLDSTLALGSLTVSRYSAANISNGELEFVEESVGLELIDSGFGGRLQEGAEGGGSLRWI